MRQKEAPMRGPECKPSYASSPHWCRCWRRAGHGFVAAGRTLLVVSAFTILCGCCAAGSGAGPTIPPLPVLTSLRPLTLDGTDGAWMDWRDAGTLDAWLEGAGVAP